MSRLSFLELCSTHTDTHIHSGSSQEVMAPLPSSIALNLLYCNTLYILHHIIVTGDDYLW